MEKFPNTKSFWELHLFEQQIKTLLINLQKEKNELPKKYNANWEIRLAGQITGLQTTLNLLDELIDKF